MINVIAAIRRKAGLTHKEYLDYITQVHARIAREQPLTISRYVQNHVFDGAFGDAADSQYRLTLPRDSVTELFFADLAAMGQCFSHPYVREKVGPDGVNFADLTTSQSLVARSHPIEVANPGSGSIKVLHFIRARGGLPLPEFFERWTAAHMAAAGAVSTQLRAYVQYRQAPEANEVLKYFGGDASAPYEGVAAMWFDEVGAVEAFRSYQRALRASADDARAFVDASGSFVVFAREHIVFDLSA